MSLFCLCFLELNSGPQYELITFTSELQLQPKPGNLNTHCICTVMFEATTKTSKNRLLCLVSFYKKVSTLGTLRVRSCVSVSFSGRLEVSLER